MQKIINKTKFIFLCGKIEKVDSDALLIWTTEKLDSGDSTFIRIHKEAGSLLYDKCISALMKYGTKNEKNETIISPGQIAFTEAGNLEQYNIIHCVSPDHRIKIQKENKKALVGSCIRLAAEMIKTYGEIDTQLNTLAIQPLSPNLYGEIDSEDLESFFETIIQTIKLKKIYFVFESEEELKEYFNVFNKLSTPFLERIINKIFKFTF